MSLSTKDNLPAKKQKKPKKTFSSKKLPSKFRKAYSEKKFNKKILKKLYIPADKDLIQKLFSNTETNKKGVTLYSIPKDKTFTKAELSHLKQIATEIKKQKGRIKLLPLIAAVTFAVVIVAGITATKNIIAKKVIVSVVQSITKARCDVRKVNIKFIESTFKLEGLEVANKNEPMKNIFSVSSITFDFDMLQLLKSRFVANELSVYGVEVNSDRTYDGTLPPKKVKQIEKKESKKTKKEKKENPLIAELQKKSQNSIDTVKNTLNSTFEQYNPETMFKNYYASLQIPDLSIKVQTDVEELIKKYSEMPAKLEEQIKKGNDIVTSVSNINYNDLAKNPAKLKEAIETITNAYNSTMEIKDTVTSTAKGVEKDFNKTTAMANDIKNAVTHDTNFVKTEIGKITSLTLKDGQQFISGTFDTILCELLGKYYPYAIKATDYLANMKSTTKEKKPKKQKTQTGRSKGRTIVFRKDNTPNFWLKKVAASGTGFTAELLDISSDMNKAGKPATGKVGLSILGLDHNATLIVDTRTNSKAPLVTADYNCDKIPVQFPLSYFDNTPGVPGLESSKAYVDCVLKLFENDGFELSGFGNLTEAKLVTTPFEPVFISDIYSNILSDINELQLKVSTGFTVSQGLKFNISTDADRVFAAALEKEIRNQIEILKNQVQTEIMNKINELTNNAFGEINSLEALQAEINKYVDYANSIVNQMDAKKKEAENLLKKGLETSAENAKKKLQEEAKSQLKKFF